MPAGRMYRKRRPRRRRARRRVANKGKYRLQAARIIRQPTLKPFSAVQKLVYYNTFFAENVLSTGATPAQQNLVFTLQLNSIYPWGASYNANISNNVLNPNNGIVALGGTNPTELPGFSDGYNLKNQYAKYLITGCKTTITANPMVDTNGVSNPAVLYAVKHTQSASGLNANSKYSTLQTLPNRMVRNIRQIGPYNSGVGAKITCYHSVKKFNNVSDLKDNSQFYGSTGGVGSAATEPSEKDYLTIGIVGKCDNPDTPLNAGKFCLNLKHEVSVLYTEMLEAGGLGGNYSFPRAAGTFKRALGTYGAAIASSYLMGM